MSLKRALAAAVAVSSPLLAEPPPPPVAWFENVAAESGIRFEHVRAVTVRTWFPEIMSGGGCWLDADGDGDLDLYLVQGGDFETRPDGPANQLYTNRGDGTFREIGDRAGVAHRGYGMGCAVGDYDGDGHEDLYVTNVGENVLYKNLGDGTFRDVTAEAGVGHPGWGTSAAFFDGDGDGDLDLFLVNYVRWSPEREIECFAGGNERDYCQPGNYNSPAPDVYYENAGDGTFRDATAAAGISKAFGNGLGVTCGDFDGDGRLDLYVANDGDPNQLWVRGEDATFTDQALFSGVAVNRYGLAEAGMGVAAVDLESDGDLDLFVTHLRDETNTLYLNRGGWFDDATTASGLASSSIGFTGFGLGFADFDHDGELDLYVANGRIGRSVDPRAPEPYAESDQLYRGLGGGRFEEVSPRGGVASPIVGNSRAAALGDYDEDGDVDVVVIENGGPARLLRNVAGKRGQSVLFSVIDRHSQVAVGAQVRLRVGDRVLWRLVQRTGSYLASHDPRVHFGLGAAKRVDEVVVVWPGGREESFGAFEAGTVHELRQGKGRTRGGGHHPPSRGAKTYPGLWGLLPVAISVRFGIPLVPAPLPDVPRLIQRAIGAGTLRVGAGRRRPWRERG